MDIAVDKGFGNVVRMRISGRFDISTHAAFRNAYLDLLVAPEVEKLSIDLSGVSYIDSAALGMLLLLRERIEPTGKLLELIGCPSRIREVFEIANFYKLFDIR